MTTDSESNRSGYWMGIMSLASVHLIAFTMLYLVLVPIAYAFEEHYQLVGYAVTDRFSWALRLSNYVSGYTWLLLCIVAADVFVLYRLVRNASRWTNAYSHAALLSIGLLAFLSIAWMIHPMVWSRPGVVNRPIAGTDNADSYLIAAMSTPSTD